MTHDTFGTLLPSIQTNIGTIDSDAFHVVLSGIVALVGGFVLFLAKRMVTQRDRKEAEQDAKIAELEREHAYLAERVANLEEAGGFSSVAANSRAK